jgi:hypothetical protein
MDPTTSSSRSVSVHFLIANASSLFGIGIFVYQMWSGASLEHVMFTGATSGLVAYLTLAVGVAGSQYIIAQAPDSDSSNEVPDASSEQRTTDTETDDEKTPEPQAA